MSDRTLARRIWLSNNFDVFCIVSAEDYAWLIEKMWNCGRSGTRRKSRHSDYAKRNVGRARSPIWMHRVIMMHADPRTETFTASHHVDHANLQTLDNRRCNLRWFTPAQNNGNRRNGARCAIVVPSVLWVWENECEDASAPITIPYRC